ncbi:hypothetical protein CVS28_14240 [Arthrobacter glacialis]|nr:hypothetical protein CVS28_14240 [Arthrobacter glacialis]
MGNVLFEDMAVALCSAEFGPGGTSFGIGTDGGREWTYDGQLPMPKCDFPADETDFWIGGQWDGYTVVQAKHKAFLDGGKRDVDWLLNTITKEVNDWNGKKGRIRKPKNFLIITNIRLSSVEYSGGIDRLNSAMKAHAASMKLEGWAVWSSIHLSRLLDNHGDIQRRYLGQLVTGDLIATLIETQKDRNVDALETITNFVSKQLYASRFVRLTRSGSGVDRESLADIGIDLPGVDRKNPVDEKGEVRSVSVAETVINSGNRPLKISDGNFATVLIGGPGQGKSTIGQLICQSYRAALLQGRADELAPADKSVLDDTLAHLRSIGLALPTMRRWPVYIQLNKYSEKLFEKGDVSLQAHITEQINDLGGGTIIKKDINSWLSDWPWMIVLDGLDEVPDAQTRVWLLGKIQQFISDAAGKKADLSILATTRAQGYQQDFDGLDPTEIDLVELSHHDALSYGKKLVNSRNPGEPSRAREIYARLESAAREPATANLMVSPLQVSIMTSLLEDRVRAPGTRHRLFAEFYETVFRRETNKFGSVGVSVELHKSDIDKLHDGAGIRLHVESEKSGQADVHLTKDHLRGIAKEYLVNVQTYEVAEAETTSSALVGLATDRLVLLVESSTDHWGFEVRSFQEFMAARFITEGDDQVVLARLEEFGRSSHWRNTWLFAVADLFDSRPWLRNSIVDMIRGFDEGTVADRIARPGAQLSTDLILDNFATSAPGLRKRLLLHCIEGLDSPSLRRNVVQILNNAADMDTVVRVAIQEKLLSAPASCGRKVENLERLMEYWSKNFTGSIATFARTKPLTASIVSEGSLRAGLAQHMTLGEILADLVDTSELDHDAKTIVDDFLAQPTSVFVKSPTTQRL